MSKDMGKRLYQALDELESTHFTIVTARADHLRLPFRSPPSGG